MKLGHAAMRYAYRGSDCHLAPRVLTVQGPAVLDTRGSNAKEETLRGEVRLNTEWFFWIALSAAMDHNGSVYV